MRRNPQRYRAAVTLAAYTVLNAVSAIFADIGFGRFNEILRAPRGKERGTWVDGRIAAACAYADVLLCDDRGMRNKVNHIAREFSFPTQAIELDTWVGA